MTVNPRLISLRVGRARRVEGEHFWITASFKEPVQGPVSLLRDHLEGDEQADTRVHGGPDKAVCVYSADHYPAWREVLDLPTMDLGAFGENFSVSGLTEDTVCLGDRYLVGSAEVEVSQPRSPCWKLARRWGRPDLPDRVKANGWSGWYLRVLREGSVEVNQELVLLERPYPAWTITRLNQLAYGEGAAPAAEIEPIVSCPALSAAWRRSLGKKLT